MNPGISKILQFIYNYLGANWGRVPIIVNQIARQILQKTFPFGLSNYSLYYSRKKDAVNYRVLYYAVYRVSREDRYLRTIRATLKTMAWSN